MTLLRSRESALPKDLRKSPGLGLLPLLLFYCLAGLTAGAQGEQRPENCGTAVDWERRVSELLAGDRLEDAAWIVRRLARCSPENPELWWRLGTIEYDRGDYAAATKAFQELLRRLPGYGPAYIFLGMAEFAKGNYAEALEHLQQGRRLGIGNDPRIGYLALLHEVKALLRLGRFTDAYPLLRQLMNSRPEDPYIQELVGAALVSMDRLPEDMSAQEKTTLRQVGRAALASESEDLETAGREFAAAVAAHPDLPNLHYAYGVFLLKVDPEKAIQQFEKELQRDPEHLASLLQLAIEYLRRAQPETALTYVRRALEIEPRSPAAHHTMGRILLQTGDIEGAIRHGEQGVALAPDRPEMHFFLAQAYARAGRTADVERERRIYEKLQQQHRKQVP